MNELQKDEVRTGDELMNETQKDKQLLGENQEGKEPMLEPQTNEQLINNDLMSNPQKDDVVISKEAITFIDKYGDHLQQLAILLVVSFVMSMVALNYVTTRDIMGYGAYVDGSSTFFGWHLSKTMWLVLMSLVSSVICSGIAYLLVLMMYAIVRKLVAIVKRVWEKERTTHKQ